MFNGMCSQVSFRLYICTYICIFDLFLHVDMYIHMYICHLKIQTDIFY